MQRAKIVGSSRSLKNRTAMLVLLGGVSARTRPFCTSTVVVAGEIRISSESWGSLARCGPSSRAPRYRIIWEFPKIRGSLILGAL